MVGLDFDDIGIFEEESSISLEVPHINNIVPSKGLYLGLDVSKNSTGLTLIENGERLTGNISLEEVDSVHREVLLRRALKEDLRILIKNKVFDLIIIEDAFEGIDPETTRLLYALNTAIDEMILDNECGCKNFIRVSNKAWKSWLSMVDSDGVAVGLNDKEKIKIYLKMIGVEEEGEGAQDRLDSTGLIVSYFLKGKELNDKGKLKKKPKIHFSDINASYDIDTSYLFYGRDDVNTDNIEFLDYRKIGKKRVLELLGDNPDKVFVTSEPILLGNLGVELGLDIIDGGGYFAFWIKPNKLKKYLKGE